MKFWIDFAMLLVGRWRFLVGVDCALQCEGRARSRGFEPCMSHEHHVEVHDGEYTLFATAHFAKLIRLDRLYIRRERTLSE